jgi:hypothetical protein
MERKAGFRSAGVYLASFLFILLACFSPLLGPVFGAPPSQPPGQARIGEILRDRGIDWKDPQQRALAVARIREIEAADKDRARVKAAAMGIPMRRVLPDGAVQEIMGLDEDGEFLVYTTHNANAAISSGANLLYPSPYSLDGSGGMVGVWDEAAVRTSHVEFATGSRATVKDGTTELSTHGTHVAGTIGAAGVSATRKGMAPAVLIDSYDWNSDTSEMTSRGATATGQVTQIYLSNHSYGYGRGWEKNASSQWQFYGTGTNESAYAAQFGQYNSYASSWDSLAYNAPYYLIFSSAGNDNDDGPVNGDTVVIGGNTMTYDSSVHPQGDGVYRSDYENVADYAIAKNVMTVGSVNDAVAGGLRDPASGTLSAFSSRGPTDDGRIKPDIVANGYALSSASDSGDTAYTSMSGTSMSSPSAAGSAALLVQLYRSLFSGGAMLSSTLKGVILHTATDIGNPGPDYQYGWGCLMSRRLPTSSSTTRRIQPSNAWSSRRLIPPLPPGFTHSTGMACRLSARRCAGPTRPELPPPPTTAARPGSSTISTSRSSRRTARYTCRT